jgi:hypothetical protein
LRCQSARSINDQLAHFSAISERHKSCHTQASRTAAAIAAYANPGATMPYREEIARRYGFESFAVLLDISQPLPKLQGDDVQWFVARKSNGNWFLWQDAELPPNEDTAHD